MGQPQVGAEAEGHLDHRDLGSDRSSARALGTPLSIWVLILSRKTRMPASEGHCGDKRRTSVCAQHAAQNTGRAHWTLVITVFTLAAHMMAFCPQ